MMRTVMASVMKSMRSSLMNSPKVYSLELPSALVTISVVKEPYGVRTSRCALKTLHAPETSTEI